MAISTALTPIDLAPIAAFAGLPAATLTWLLAHGEMRAYTDGESIINAGDTADFRMAVLRGGVQFYAVKGSQRDPIFRVGAGQVSGVLPYSRLREAKNQGTATDDTLLYLLHRDQSPALEQASPELVQRLVAIINDRSRDQVRAQERDDKLRTLGKLSASLAHELNNPTAAIAHAAQALKERAQANPALLAELVGHCPPPEAMRALTELAVPAETPPPPVSAKSAASIRCGPTLSTMPPRSRGPGHQRHRRKAARPCPARVHRGQTRHRMGMRPGALRQQRLPPDRSRPRDGPTLRRILEKTARAIPTRNLRAGHFRHRRQPQPWAAWPSNSCTSTWTSKN
ncbi:hypothetical protein [Hymenobacter antarcticus]|uniref:Cyclic nucleotide-binding domain-containing protein n=1 Tax=Hymenobacter antarcticus TaxID=486270 RepID=A0ABP7P016_9BACT